jgi:hypothetical protein
MRSTEECDVLHRGQRQGADHAGEASEVLGQHRVALVRHGAGTLLAGREKLFHFQDFRALQMTDFGGESVGHGVSPRNFVSGRWQALLIQLSPKAAIFSLVSMTSGDF